MNIFIKLSLICLYIFFNTSYTSEKVSIQQDNNNVQMKKTSANIYNEASLEFLIKSGLTTNMSVLNIGSGEGNLISKIGTIVGIKGLVKSIHIVEASFKNATLYTKDLPQVQHELYDIKLCDIFDIFSTLPTQSFDVIYIRLDIFTSSCMKKKTL